VRVMLKYSYSEQSEAAVIGGVATAD
jgi:hypothetical protein